jgi:hypothetical protein
LIIAATAVLVRTVAHAVLAVTERFQPETAIAVIVDVPAMLAYYTLSVLGFGYDVNGFIDRRFFVIGTLTWFAGGMVIGAVVELVRRRKSPKLDYS